MAPLWMPDSATSVGDWARNSLVPHAAVAEDAVDEDVDHVAALPRLSIIGPVAVDLHPDARALSVNGMYSNL